MDVTHDVDDAGLVERVQRGDSAAFAPLFERWYDRVYGVARGVVRRPDLAADVAQDAFVAAWQQIDRLDDVNAFGGWLLRITRNRALDALRHEQRSSAIDDDTLTALTDRGVPSPVAARPLPGPVEAAESQAQADLLWASAAALGERDASILDLHVRHGLTAAELAADLGVEPNHAHQLMYRLRKRLGEAVGAFLLWNDGSPNCEALAARTPGTFDAAAADTIMRHARTCDTCSDDRSRRVDPVKLFAAIPVAVAPLAFRSKAAWALESAGAPMPRHLLGLADTAPAPGDSGTSASGDEGRAASGDEGGSGSGGADGGGRRSAAARRVGAVTMLVVIMLGASAALFADQARAPGRALDDVTAASDTTMPVSIAPATSAAVTTSTAATTTTTTTIDTTTTSLENTTTTTTTAPPAPPPPPPPPRDPVVPPPPPPPPDPVEPAVDTTTSTSTLPPPTVVRFVLRPATHGCNTKALSRTATWSTEGATSGELRWPAGSLDIGASPTGTAAICIEEGTQATLEIFNAAGTSAVAVATATP